MSKKKPPSPKGWPDTAVVKWPGHPKLSEEFLASTADFCLRGHISELRGKFGIKGASLYSTGKPTFQTVKTFEYKPDWAD
jgi:hypothetical protein